MKFAYLMYSSQKYRDIVPVVRMLTKQGDHVFIMINNDKERDEITVFFANNRNVHISRKLEFAQEGDLSLARGTLLQMVDAFECDEHFDYFINLTEGMLPVKPREEIEAYLRENPDDHYFISRSEKEDPDLRKQISRYYAYTNVIGFPTSKYVRFQAKALAGFLNLIGVRRKLEETVYIGSPWFILTNKTARVLAENYAYCSQNFKLSWYAEEMCYIMMIKHFIPNNEHVNNDMRVIGPDGLWKQSNGARKLTQEVLDQYPDALFGASILAKDDKEFYDRILKTYNRNFKHKDHEKKEVSESDFNEMVSKIKRKDSEE